MKVLDTGLGSPGPLPCTCLVREGRHHGSGENDVAVNNQKSILAAYSVKRYEKAEVAGGVFKAFREGGGLLQQQNTN